MRLRVLEDIKRWAVGLLYGIAALVVLVSVVSYTVTDHSLIYDSTYRYENAHVLGSLGAHVGGLLIYFFGCSSILLSIFLVLVGLYTVGFSYDYVDRGRYIGVLVLLVVSATIAHRYSFEVYSGVYPGGLIGSSVHACIVYFLDEVLIDYFLGIVVWTTMVVVVRFSLIASLVHYLIVWLRPVGRVLGYSVQWIYKKVQEFVPVVKEPELSDIYSDSVWQGYMYPVRQEQPEIIVSVAAYREKETKEDKKYRLPQYEKASLKEPQVDKLLKAESEQQARMLEHKLERFGIQGKVTAITQGPVVTLFEYQPSIDTKISNILAREDDLALALQAVSLRIIAPIPGKSVIGLEVAHSKRSAVLFSALVNSDNFVHCKGVLPLILGKDTLGTNVIIDLAAMPHLLVAGSTGSGKSVGLNCMLMSLLCGRTPQEVRLILIDPKRLEFSLYADCAHLLFPLITDPAQAGSALRWAVKTMEERYMCMAEKGVRNVQEYNARAQKMNEEQLPFIVIMIDELADLMMTAGKDIEHLIARLAQMARAAGIHLIIATQRPSVDVITGLIKVNFPSRIAFKVTSKVDSRTILDAMGAEKLLGRGDMLFLDGKGLLNRVHGAYVTDEEIKVVVDHIKEQQPVSYLSATVPVNDSTTQEDPLYEEILSFLAQKDEVSISLLQRAFSIGYNRSARIIDQLENQGYIMPANGSKMRRVAKESLKNHQFSNKI